MCEKVMNYFKKNRVLILFFSFLLFYLVLGMCFSNYFKVENVYDFLFEADTPRIIGDYSQIFGNHYRTIVHPLICIIVQPIILLLTGITQDNILSCIIFSSIIGALQVVLMYKTISLLNNKDNISLIISIIFGLTFSNIIFNSSIELYNLAAISMQLLWYFVIKLIYKNEKLNKDIFFILLVIGILCLGITITNYIVFLIACFVLLISKKVSIKELIKLNLFIVIGFFLLNYIQYFVWNNTPLLIGNMDFEGEASASWVDYSINLYKIKNLIYDGFFNCVMSSSLFLNYSTKNPSLGFENMSILNNGLMILFYIFILIYTIKNFKKHLYINIGLILSLVFNSIFHIIYGNQNVFLYTQHFNYLIFILLGINLMNFKNFKKIILTILILFIIFLFINNIYYYGEILKFASGLMERKFFGNFSLIFNIILVIIIFAYYLICLFILRKNTKNINQVKVTKIIILVIAMILPFIAVRTSIDYNKMLGINLEKFKNIYVPEAIIFEENYNDEIKKYKKYIKQYNIFCAENSSELVDLNNGKEYYFLGFNDRKKLLYIDGKLKDIENNKVIYQWDVKKQIIIPNIYTVLIETTDNKFIKIYEDENGVHIADDKDIIIEGTKSKINLYDFSKENYSEILSTLYGEILFNVKDGEIYPNIIVYDDNWYRDAAITSMVLEYTNNINIIEDWINSIENVYDMQNFNVKEPDNLGELLYMLSLPKNKNKELINKVIKEAKDNAKNNPYGYYLYGTTDGGYLNKYQSIWYEFGLSKHNIKNDFDNVVLEDGYSSTTWWAGDCNSNLKTEPIKFYPYLAWGHYHCGVVKTNYMNSNLYPLSWEMYGSQADYENMEILDEHFVKNKISPTHTWTASEIFMYIIKKS